MTHRSLLTLSGVARLSLFALAVFALLNLADRFAFFRVVVFQLGRGDSATPVRNAVIYAGAYLVGLAGLVVLYNHASRWIRVPAWVATALAVTVFMGFRSVNGYGFTYHEASLLWGEVDFFPAALVSFLGHYALPVLAALAVVWGLARVARARVPRIGSLALCLIPVAAFAAYDQLLDRTYGKVTEAPVPYRVPVLTAWAWRHRIPWYGEREATLLSPSGSPLADHFVLIMDESVSGDMLGINGGEAETTPFLASLGGRVLNYGIASSISNLSSTTNLALQSGLRRDQVPDRALRSLKGPNLFSYMQAAGFRAFLIDNQIYSGRPNNLMTRFDLDALDGHLLLRTLENEAADDAIDYVAIDYLERIVRENERSFSYLLKVGAHFPYDRKYPAGEAVFRPTLSEGGSGGNLEKTLNSYRNALRWNADGFLRALVERLGALDRDVILVYTADHGQSLFASVDDGGQTVAHRPARWPHGVPVDPPPRQASVPLLLAGFGEGVSGTLGALYEPGLRDRVSQFELFPALLELAGYDRAEIRRHYHFGLFEREAARGARFFVSGNLFGIGGGFYTHELVESSCHVNEFTLE